MAVSTERDPVALRADLAGWLAAPDRRRRRRGRRGQHPGPVGVLERDASLRGHVGRGGPPARDPRRADRPHRLPEHRLRRPGAGDAGAARRGHACRCPRCCGSRRARTMLGRPLRVHGAGSRARCPPTTPATTARAGCRRSTRRASGASGRAGSTRWRRIHRLDRAAHRARLDRRRQPRRAARARSPVPHLRLRRRARTPRWTAPSSSSRRRVPPASRPARAVLGRLAHRQHDLRRRPAGGRGARLGDGHGGRPRPGPRLVPAARPPPHDGLRRRRASRGSRRARSRSLAGRRRAGTRPTHLEWYELLGAARYASIMVRVMKLLD